MFDIANEAERPPGGEMFAGREPGYLEIAGKGLMRGGVRAARGALLATSVFAEDPDRLFRINDEYLDPAEEFWKVDTSTAGTARKIVSAVAELPLQLVGGGSFAALSAAMNTGTEMVDQGVDSTTATGAAVLSGGAMAAMIAMPQAGRTIRETLALVAANPVTGAATDYATKALLQAKGYDAQARNIDPFDIPARSVDLLLGGIFGGVAHYGKWRAKAPTEVVDAIDTVEASRQRENLNPFKPGTIAAKNHAAALESALDNLTSGRPVDVSQHYGKQVEQVEAVSFGAAELRARALEKGMETAVVDNVLTQLAARASAMGLPVDTFIEKYATAESEALPSAARIIAASLDSFERKQLDTWLFSQVPGARWDDSHLQQLGKALDDFMTGSEMKPSVKSALARIVDPLPIKTDLPPEVLAIREELGAVARELEAEQAAGDVQPIEPDPPPRQWTEAQEAASRRVSEQARTVNRQSDSAITAIAKLGGLDLAEATSQWGNLVKDGRKALNAHVLQQTRRFGTVFKKDGVSLDTMRENLVQHGYLPEGADLNALYDIVERGTRGEFAKSQEYAADLDALEREYWESRGYPSAADLLLAEQGDIMIHDGTDAEGQDVYRSAQELLDEMRAEIEMEQGQEHLYQRAAVCMNLG